MSELPIDKVYPGLSTSPDGRLGVKLPNCDYWLVDPYVADNDRAQAAYNAAYTWAMEFPEMAVLKELPSQYGRSSSGKVISENRADDIATMHAISTRDNVLLPHILVGPTGKRLLSDKFTERQLNALFADDKRVLELLHPFMWDLLSDASSPLG